jgi:hypothetical protein
LIAIKKEEKILLGTLKRNLEKIALSYSNTQDKNISNSKEKPTCTVPFQLKLFVQITLTLFICCFPAQNTLLI